MPLCFAALPESIPRVLLLPATLAVLGEQWHDPSHSKCRRSCCLSLPVSSLTLQTYQTRWLIAALSSDVSHVQTGSLGWSILLNKHLWQLKKCTFDTYNFFSCISKRIVTLLRSEVIAYITLEYTRKEKTITYRKETELGGFFEEKATPNQNKLSKLNLCCCLEHLILSDTKLFPRNLVLKQEKTMI